MRLPHHLLRHPLGMWHFRLIVPCDLRACFGRSVLKHSLRIHDPAEARQGAYFWSAHYAQLFADAWSGAGSMGRRHDDEPPVVERPVVIRSGTGNELVGYSCEFRVDGSIAIQAEGAADRTRDGSAPAGPPDGAATHPAKWTSSPGDGSRQTGGSQ